MSVSQPFFDNEVMDGPMFSLYWSDWLQRVRQSIGLVNELFSTTVAHTFTSIASGATQTMTVPMVGVGINDDVTLGLSSLQNGLVYQAYVNVVNNIIISCTNVSAGAITPTAGDIRITVRSF